MYQQYFGLKGSPFADTPDPAFYFESRSQHEVLAYLRHGTSEGTTFVAMTGEAGAGKTTVRRRLTSEIDTQHVELATLAGLRLDAQQLLIAMLRAFGLPGRGLSWNELQARLNEHLAALAADGRRALVVIDDAHGLLPDAIAFVTQLAAQQVREGTPLQMLLVGQPSLRATLKGEPVAGAGQPVFRYCHVGLLTASETRGYIEHRLRRVGWKNSPMWSAEAFERIDQATEGVPRRINQLCERLLAMAAQLGEKAISARLVDQVDAELRREMSEAADVAAESAAVAPRSARAPDVFSGEGLRAAQGSARRTPTLATVRAATLARAAGEGPAEPAPRPPAADAPAATRSRPVPRLVPTPPPRPTAVSNGTPSPFMRATVQPEAEPDATHGPELQADAGTDAPPRSQRFRAAAISIGVAVAALAVTWWVEHRAPAAQAVPSAPALPTPPARAVPPAAKDLATDQLAPPGATGCTPAVIALGLCSRPPTPTQE